MKTNHGLAVVFICITTMQSVCHAQHLRIYACAIANDSVGASMGGSSNGSGLYQSDDTGKTWKHLGWDNIKCYSMDMLQSSNGRILYEATGLGILRSVDGGAHWKQITDWRISEVMDVAVNQKNPDEIYIATAHGPWRSEDGGKSWSRFYTDLSKGFCRVRFNDSSKVEFFDGKLIRECSQDVSWISIVQQDSTGDLPPFYIVATLSNGIYWLQRPEYPPGEGVRQIFDCDHSQCVLPMKQIWRLRSFYVTP